MSYWMVRRASFDFQARGRGGASQKVDGPNVPGMDPSSAQGAGGGAGGRGGRGGGGLGVGMGGRTKLTADLCIAKLAV